MEETGGLAGKGGGEGSSLRELRRRELARGREIIEGRRVNGGYRVRRGGKVLKRRGLEVTLGEVEG